MLFSCFLCQRKMDYSNVCEELAEIYCNNCHFKNFGPVGVKYQLPNETTGKIKTGNEEQACPRCGGAVFEMEKVQLQSKLFELKFNRRKSTVVKDYRIGLRTGRRNNTITVFTVLVLT